MTFLRRTRHGRNAIEPCPPKKPHAVAAAFKPIVGDTCFLISAMKGSVYGRGVVGHDCFRLFKALTAAEHRFQFSSETWGEFEKIAKQPGVDDRLTEREKDNFIIQVGVVAEHRQTDRRVTTHLGIGDDMVLSVGLRTKAPVVTCDRGILKLRGNRAGMPEIYTVSQMFALVRGGTLDAPTPKSSGRPLQREFR